MTLVLRRIVLLVFAVISCNLTWTQEFPIDVYGASSKENVSNHVYSIDQDKSGLLWLGTLNGLSTFDGVEFETYKVKDGLLQSHISAVFIDSRDQIWLGTWNSGFQVWGGARYGPESCNLDSLPSKRVTVITEDNEGKVWVGVNGALLRVSLDKSGEIIIEEKYRHGASASDIEFIDQQIWVSTFFNGIFVIDPLDGSMKRYTTKDGLENNMSFCLYKEGENLWVGNYGGVTLYDGSKLIKYRLPGHYNGNRVHSILRINDSIFELGTYGNGVVRWNMYDNKYQTIGLNSGIKYPFIKCSLVDLEGNSWYGTEGNGIFRVRSWNSFLENNIEGFEDKDLTAIYRTQKGEEYLAFYGKGLLKRKNHKNVKVFDKNEGVYSPYIRLLFEHGDSLMVGGTGGLAAIFQEKGTPVTEQCGDGSIQRTIISGFSKNAQIHLSLNHKIMRFNDTDCKTLNVDEIKTEGRVILPWGENYLYGCQTGVYMIDFQLSKMKRLDQSFEKPIFEGIKDSWGNFWLSSKEELIHFNAQNEKFTYWNGEDFFEDNTIASLYEHQKNLYFIVNNSVRKLNLNEYYSTGVLRAQTILSLNEFQSDKLFFVPKAVYASGDTLYLGTSQGLMHVDVNRKPMIGRATLNIKSVSSSQKFISSQSIGGIIEFEPGDKYFTFSFRGIYLTEPDSVRYRYRLKGLNNEWIYLREGGSVRYEYLPAGDYEFEVMCTTSAGTWDKATKKTIKIKVLAPFYKTLWFWGVVFVVVFMVIFSIIRYRILFLKRKADERKKYARKLLVSVEEERKRIARDLHDGVAQNLILAKEAIINVDQDSIKFVQQAIEDIRVTSKNIHPSQLEHSGITSAIEELVESLDKATQIIFTEDIDNIDDILSDEQQLHLFRFIQEACNNIIKHSEASAARIFTKFDGAKGWRLFVIDNGKGFNQSNYSESLGMTTMKERAIILAAEMHVHSDKSGTKLTLKFKND